jgi:hypothetical protein
MSELGRILFEAQAWYLLLPLDEFHFKGLCLDNGGGECFVGTI